jgi:hypothetical protein
MIAETTPGGLALRSSAACFPAGGRLTRQLFRFGLLSPSAPLPIILQMILVQLLQVCREELRKAKPAIIAAYEMVREADDRALQTLLLFFQDR